MRIHPLHLFIAVVSVIGCTSDMDTDTDTGAVPAEDVVLTTADGTEISSDSLRCIYRQSTGSNITLSLQLQYLDSPDSVAFALYFNDPVPAAPFAVAAGQQGRFDFEVFVEKVGYGDELNNGEVEVLLDNLPSPSALSDGDIVPLKGKLLIGQFSLNQRSASGETDGSVLNLASGSVEIDCDAIFSFSEVVD